MNEKGLLWESLFLCTQGRRVYAAYVACLGAASMGEFILKPYFGEYQYQGVAISKTLC